MISQREAFKAVVLKIKPEFQLRGKLSLTKAEKQAIEETLLLLFRQSMVETTKDPMSEAFGRYVKALISDNLTKNPLFNGDVDVRSQAPKSNRKMIKYYLDMLADSNLTEESRQYAERELAALKKVKPPKVVVIDWSRIPIHLHPKRR